MSDKYFNRQWGEVQNELLEILELEPSTDPPKPTEKHFPAAFQSVAVLFLKYINIFRNLDITYDQVIHPQKRRVIRSILDGTMGRILELKNEMVTLECLDFHFFDDLLTDLKMSPADMEIPIPKYFLQEQAHILNERRNMLQYTLDSMYLKVEEPEMDENDAILLIQSHERARQNRLRVKFLFEIQERERRAHRRLAATPKEFNPHIAATKIQKTWKMYITKKKTAQLRQEELAFLGMIPKPTLNYESILRDSQERCEQRRIVRDDDEIEYLKAVEVIKYNMKEKEGKAIKEKLVDQICQWLLECRNATGKFPDLPDEDEGGTATLFVTKDPEELKQELIQQDEDAERKDDKKDKLKDKKEKEKPKEKEKKKKDEEEEEGWQMTPSNFLPVIRDGDNIYKEIWKKRVNSESPLQKFDPLLVKEEKMKEVEEEVRIEVDKLMRQELERLRMVVDKDISKPKKKKKKKARKRKSKKMGKDLTPDRTLASLFEELIMEGILIPSQPVKLSDIVGEINFVASTLLQGQIQPMPSLADIRQLLTCYAILPLGSQIVHEKSPVIKSILLAGPIGVGKRMLVQAVCYETGANLFDLSAANIVGKYPGKKGLEMLMHLVSKVGRLLQPSVIYVSEAEKMFQKKIPKAEMKTDPRRLKKALPKFVKRIQPSDRLIVIGTSNIPYNSMMKPLAKCFQKIIMVPRPDYSSRKLMWKKMINEAGGIITDHLDIGTLSKISDGYVGRQFWSSITEVMTEKRLVTQKTIPLTSYEFISPLILMEPVLKYEEEKLQKWYEKTPLGKKRQSLFVKEEDDGSKDKKGGKDKMKKGKK